MIFLVDTPVDIKSGYSYVINRDEDKYTMIEGNVKIFDKIAFDLKERGITDKPYDTLVLSFKEEDLTLEEIQEIYYDWKELYLGSYDEDEYYITSVIHWDDSHPHIHVGIINRSVVNEKHLRMTRYGIDNRDTGRNGAIQELINYKYGLKSPIGEKFLYQTTREQKKRDWEAKLFEKTGGKSGKAFYEVEDDKIYDFIRATSFHSRSFEEFWNEMKKEFPDIEIKSKFDEEVSVNIGKKRFKSLIFNEEFWAKHISDINAGEDRFYLEGLRKSEEEYKDLFEDKNSKHHAELLRRNIHEGLLEHKINNGELAFLKDSIDIDKEFEKLRGLKDLKLKKKSDIVKLEKFLSGIDGYIFCKEDLENLLRYLNLRIKEVNEFGIVITKEDKETTLINEKLNNIYSVKKGDIEYLKRIDTSKKTKLKSFIDKSTLKKREDIDLIKHIISNDVIDLNISNNHKFEAFLAEIGLEKVNDGHSITRGGYITLQKIGGGKKFSIYDDLLYSYYSSDIELENEALENNSLDSILKDLEGNNDLKPESVNEYKLKYGKNINLKVINLTNDNVEISKYPKRIKRDRKAKAIIHDFNDQLVVKSALSFEDSSNAVIDVLDERKWKYLKLSGSDEGYQKSLISGLQYLSKHREDSRKWIDEIMIEADVNKNVLNINKGEVYEITFNEVNLDDMMNDDFITVKEDDTTVGDTESVSELSGGDSVGVEITKEEIKNDFKTKIGDKKDKKITVNKIGGFGLKV